MAEVMLGLYNGIPTPVQVGSDGQLQLNLTGEGLALDVSVDGLEAGIGATNESAASTDTATSGLNGLIKRLLQYFTAPATGTKSNVNDTNASTTILAANASRKGATFWNDSTAVLYLDLSGGTASATSCSVKIAADGYFELPDNGKRGVYTGLITGIWASDASGAVRVTEFT